MAFVIEQITMTGLEYDYTIPLGTLSIVFRPASSDTTFATASGGDTYTVKSEGERGFQNRGCAGQHLYLTGTDTHIVEIWRETGMGS